MMISLFHILGVRRPSPAFGVCSLLCVVACLAGMGVFPGVPVSAEASERVSTPVQLGGGLLERMDERARDDFLEAKKLGTRIVELHGKPSFFAYWLPSGFQQLPEKRIMILLHGHKGNPFRQILWMHNAALEYGFGLLAMPWEWTSGSKKEYRQIRPETLYVAMTRALGHMETHYRVDKRLSAWLGFSKAARMCAQFAFLDRSAGDSYFQLFIAVSGHVGRRAPFMKKLLDGKWGPKPLSGKRFYLWCGETDQRLLCPGVERGGSLLERAGANVVRIRKGSEGHAGFYGNPVYMQETVRYWRQPKP